MNSQILFRRSRTRLACGYGLIMGGILGMSGLGLSYALVQTNWTALEREIESTAGTLHDSLEPRLPITEDPTSVLKQILPDLCLARQPCESRSTFIERHTIGISDRSTYYIRLFDQQGKLLAFSSNQPSNLPTVLNPTPWQTIETKEMSRYRQFTTILHGHTHTHTPGEAPHQHPSWGYLQVGRNLATYDADIQRIRLILILGFPVSLFLVGGAGWWLSGLAMRPIYDAYQRQQQFTANVAHELRSPLASLLATIEAGRRAPSHLQSNIPSMLSTLERQGRRLNQLFSDLLLLTSLEQEALSHSPQPVNLNDLMTDLAEEYAEFATAAQIRLEPQIPTQEIHVLGYESQLYRLVSNLIANAIQFTPEGGVIQVSLKSQNRHAMIQVKDTGVGIPLSDQGRIFEQFYRVNCDRSRKSGGTGLGLAIAQAIVKRHQGQLTVQSEVDLGSIFTVTLPWG